MLRCNMSQISPLVPVDVAFVMECSATECNDRHPGNDARYTYIMPDVAYNDATEALFARNLDNTQMMRNVTRFTCYKLRSTMAVELPRFTHRPLCPGMLCAQCKAFQMGVFSFARGIVQLSRRGLKNCEYIYADAVVAPIAPRITPSGKIEVTASVFLVAMHEASSGPVPPPKSPPASPFSYTTHVTIVLFLVLSMNASAARAWGDPESRRIDADQAGAVAAIIMCMVICVLYYVTHSDWCRAPVCADDSMFDDQDQDLFIGDLPDAPPPAAETPGEE